MSISKRFSEQQSNSDNKYRLLSYGLMTVVIMATGQFRELFINKKWIKDQHPTSITFEEMSSENKKKVQQIIDLTDEESLHHTLWWGVWTDVYRMNSEDYKVISLHDASVPVWAPNAWGVYVRWENEQLDDETLTPILDEILEEKRLVKKQ